MSSKEALRPIAISYIEGAFPNELGEYRKRLEGIIGERRALLPEEGVPLTNKKIGGGEVEIGSSMEASLKVGQARKRVRKSIPRLEGWIKAVDEELSAYQEAGNYFSRLKSMEFTIADLRELVASGDLEPGVFEKHLGEYELFRAKPESDPAFAGRLEAIKGKANEVTEGLSREVPQEVGEVEKEDLLASLFTKHHWPPKEEALLRALRPTYGTPGVVKTSRRLAEEIYPDVPDKSKSLDRTHRLLWKVRRKLDPLGYAIVRREEEDIAGYRLTSIGNKPPVQEESQRIKTKVEKETQEIHFTLLGDVVQVGGEIDIKNRLTRDQSRILDFLGKNRTYKISELQTKFPEIAGKDALIIARQLNRKLSQSLGVEDVVVFAEEPDGEAQISLSPNVQPKVEKSYLPPYNTRLEALQYIFANPSPSRERVIEILGPTRGKQRPHPLAPQQAKIALIRASVALHNRSGAGISLPIEEEVNEQIERYCQIYDLSRNDLANRFTEVLSGQPLTERTVYQASRQEGDEKEIKKLLTERRLQVVKNYIRETKNNAGCSYEEAEYVVMSIVRDKSLHEQVGWFDAEGKLRKKIQIEFGKGIGGMTKKVGRQD